MQDDDDDDDDDDVDDVYDDDDDAVDDDDDDNDDDDSDDNDATSHTPLIPSVSPPLSLRPVLSAPPATHSTLFCQTPRRFGDRGVGVWCWVLGVVVLTCCWIEFCGSRAGAPLLPVAKRHYCVINCIIVTV